MRRSGEINETPGGTWNIQAFLSTIEQDMEARQINKTKHFQHQASIASYAPVRSNPKEQDQNRLNILKLSTIIIITMIIIGGLLFLRQFFKYWHVSNIKTFINI